MFVQITIFPLLLSNKREVLYGFNKQQWISFECIERTGKMGQETGWGRLRSLTGSYHSNPL